MRIRTALSGVLALSLSSIASCASAGLLIKVDKSSQTLTVLRDGRTLHTWPVSTGKTGHATPSGSFTAFRMEAEHFSKEWDDAPMPHSVFFTKQGHAIHGSYEIKRLGLPASHGCVRLAPKNAARLFALVKEEGLSNSRVVLTGSEKVALAKGKAQRVAGQGDRERSAGTPPNDELRTDSHQYPTQGYADPPTAPYFMRRDLGPARDGYPPPQQPDDYLSSPLFSR